MCSPVRKPRHNTLIAHRILLVVQPTPLRQSRNNVPSRFVEDPVLKRVVVVVHIVIPRWDVEGGGGGGVLVVVYHPALNAELFD